MIDKNIGKIKIKEKAIGSNKTKTIKYKCNKCGRTKVFNLKRNL